MEIRHVTHWQIVKIFRAISRVFVVRDIKVMSFLTVLFADWNYFKGMDTTA